MDSYSKLQIFEKQLTGVTLGLTPHDEWAAKCLLCFGPENQDEKAQHGEAYVCLCMDGNFQHRHHQFASKDTADNTNYPSIFIPPSQINNHEVQCTATDGEASGIRTSCSDTHKAAKNVHNSSLWDKLDDTELFGSCCRHDIPLKMNNIEQTGEKYELISLVLNLAIITMWALLPCEYHQPPPHCVPR
ncbi:hypothetical protein Pst134EB_014078 [Puccinia striiformis f. sp. tritici]|uniref:Uncharacterized protein n=1 Tax=Puccinia striiformis f. sp. tritici PST-78 TaxID=1165861 RepID=A0A0L0VGX0_9BASI|nr:hypothetical protein Pst134EB_014078 [Puccinia striiformis f. sp. tritici]KNE98520.1 hypothetical protein PSTG_08260 [Puccinia striiformis f. sp. tritici PST-78]